MKTLFSGLFVTSIFAALVGSFVSSAPDIIADENRMRAKFPQFDIKRSFKKYFSGVDRFAADHFPFRERLIDLTSSLLGTAAVGTGASVGKVIRGIDEDWLFLGNDSSQHIDKLEGRLDSLTVKPYQAYGIERLALWFQQQGVNVMFLLGPNKSSVYPEKLPAIVKPAVRRYADRSLDRLRSAGIPVIDPTAALRERKSTDILYWKRDTHWNQIGASVAFELVMDHMGVRNCPSWEFKLTSDFSPTDLEHFGLFTPPAGGTRDNYEVLWDDNADISDEEVVDYPGVVAGETIRVHSRTNSQAAQNSTVWVIGDSFSGQFMPFVTHCFSRAEFIFYNIGVYDNLKNRYEQAQFKPSTVIIEMVERMF